MTSGSSSTSSPRPLTQWQGELAARPAKVKGDPRDIGGQTHTDCFKSAHSLHSVQLVHFFADFFSIKCILYEPCLHTFLPLCTLYIIDILLLCTLIADCSCILIPAVQTSCIPILCCADFLSRVNVFHSNTAARSAGARQPFIRRRWSRGGGAMAAAAAGSYAPGRSGPRVRRRALPPYWAKRRQRRRPPPPPSRAKRSGQSDSVVHRVPPPPAAGVARRGGASRAGGQRRAGMREGGRPGRRGIGQAGCEGLGGTGAGSRCASKQEPAPVRTRPAGPRCAGMRERREGWAEVHRHAQGRARTRWLGGSAWACWFMVKC
jgi:hypothetical protein